MIRRGWTYTIIVCLAFGFVHLTALADAVAFRDVNCSRALLQTPNRRKGKAISTWTKPAKRWFLLMTIGFY
jgi:hypothetical protein